MDGLQQVWLPNIRELPVGAAARVRSASRSKGSAGNLTCHVPVQGYLEAVLGWMRNTAAIYNPDHRMALN